MAARKRKVNGTGTSEKLANPDNFDGDGVEMEAQGDFQDDPEMEAAEAARGGGGARKPTRAQRREADAAQAKESLLSTLLKLDNGRALEEVGKHFQTLIKALKDRASVTGSDAKGHLTFTLSAEADEEAAVTLSYRSEIKVPRRVGGKTVLYATDDGYLVDDDPKQPMLPGLAAPSTPRGKTYLTDASGNVVGEA